MEDTTETAPVWAVIELMGHVKYGGLVSKDNQFGTPLLRVDVPQEDGSFVSQLVNPSSLYRLTICDELLAREAAKSSAYKPMQAWEVKHLLPAQATAGMHILGGEPAGSHADDDDIDTGVYQ